MKSIWHRAWPLKAWPLLERFGGGSWNYGSIQQCSREALSLLAPPRSASLFGIKLCDWEEVEGWYLLTLQFSSVQSLSRVWLFVTPWIAACQAALSINNSQSLPTFMSIESVMPSSHLILLSPSPPAPNPSQHQSFPMSQFFAWGGQSTGASASVSVLSVNIQGWFPLRLTGLISLQSITLYYFALTLFSDTALKALTYVSSCNVLNNLKKFIQRYQVPLLITET